MRRILRHNKSWHRPPSLAFIRSLRLNRRSSAGPRRRLHGYAQTQVRAVWKGKKVDPAWPPWTGSSSSPMRSNHTAFGFLFSRLLSVALGYARQPPRGPTARQSELLLTLAVTERLARRGAWPNGRENRGAGLAVHASPLSSASSPVFMSPPFFCPSCARLPGITRHLLALAWRKNRRRETEEGFLQGDRKIPVRAMNLRACRGRCTHTPH